MFKLLRDFAVEEIFSYEWLNARKEEKLSTDKLPPREVQDWPLSYELLKSRKRRIFLPTSYIQGQVRESQGSRWVHQGWSIATRSGREKVKKRNWSIATKRGREKVKKRKEKKKTKVGKKVAPAKARFRLPYNKNSFFLVHEYLGLEAARLGWSISSYETWSTRKPCAKEVPETDYYTQQKQYLKRTTLSTNAVKALP